MKFVFLLVLTTLVSVSLKAGVSDGYDKLLSSLGFTRNELKSDDAGLQTVLESRFPVGTTEKELFDAIVEATKKLDGDAIYVKSYIMDDPAVGYQVIDVGVQSFEDGHRISHWVIFRLSKDGKLIGSGLAFSVDD